MRNLPSRLLAGLLLALAITACNEGMLVGETPAAQLDATQTPTTQTATPRMAPQPTTRAEPSPTIAPTATPLPTIGEPTPRPSATQVQATAELPPQQAALPADSPWVFSSDRVLAIAPGSPEVMLPGEFQRGGISRMTAAPDGSRFIFASGSQLVAVSAADGQSQTLVNDQRDIASPQFSPDSQSIVFASVEINSWELRVIDIGSGEERVLQSGARNPLLPLAWTPEGIFAEAVVWASDANPQQLALIDPEGGEVQPIEEQPFRQAVTSADGSRVALLRGMVVLGEPQATTSIAVLDPASGDQQLVLPESELWVAHLSWSPDAEQIVFTSMPQTTQTADTLHVISADGSQQRQAQLSELGLAGSIKDVRWSDSLIMLLIAGEDGLLHVYRIANDLSAASIQELGALEGGTEPGQANQLLYIP